MGLTNGNEGSSNAPHASKPSKDVDLDTDTPQSRLVRVSTATTNLSSDQHHGADSAVTFRASATNGATRRPNRPADRILAFHNLASEPASADLKIQMKS
jgi:hypothetical protein